MLNLRMPLLLLATTLLPALACATHSHQAADHLQGQRVAWPSGKPIAKLALAPMQGVPGPLADEQVRGQLQAIFVEVLQQRGICVAAVCLPGPESLSPEDARKQAAILGADMVLHTLIISARLRFGGRNQGAFINTLFWAGGGGYLSNWVHDHDYELQLKLELRGVDPLGGEELFRQELPLVVTRQALNFHERTTNGWYYLLENIWPPTLCPAQTDGLIENLAPPALSDATTALFETLKDVQVEPAYYQIEQLPREGLSLDLRSPRPGARVLRREAFELDLRIAVSAPDRHLVQVSLDGAPIWPTGLPEGITAPPRRNYDLQCVGQILERRAVRVEVLDSAGEVSTLEIRREEAPGG